MDPTSDSQTSKPSLRALRESRGLSIRAAAQIVDVHHSTLARYEDGVHEPQTTELVALAGAYGVTVEAVIAAVLDGRKERA